jgi:threonine synthase
VGTRESTKTIAYEVAEQLAAVLGPAQPGCPWRAPDWYIQAVSGGMGPIGFWKGFQELYRMGLVDRVPKLALVQADGCAPMVNAFNKDLTEAEVVTDPKTRVITIATGAPGPAYTFLYHIMKEHDGVFEAVPDEETFRALHILAKIEGLSIEPAAATAFAGLFKLLNKGIIKRNEVIIVNCSGHTFPVEKFLLDEDWLKVVPAGPIEAPVQPSPEQAPPPSSEDCWAPSISWTREYVASLLLRTTPKQPGCSDEFCRRMANSKLSKPILAKKAWN